MRAAPRCGPSSCSAPGSTSTTCAGRTPGLAYVKDGGDWHLRHLFSDVGSGLSDAHPCCAARTPTSRRCAWTVTESEGGKVKFSGFAPNVMNDAFAHTSAEDARWMLRRLAGLSENQILQALLATSMSASEVRLALEKLLSKRQKMVADFGLSSSFPRSRAAASTRAWSSIRPSPKTCARSRCHGRTGRTVVPERGDWVIQKGHLVRRVARRLREPCRGRRPRRTPTGATKR